MGFVYHDNIGYVELVDHMGDDSTVVKSARVSYNKGTKDSESDSRLIRYMLTHGHTSPFEHINFTFEIKCPVFVARQIMRHRTFSYNELSRRYTSDNIEFYIPKSLRMQDTQNRQSSLDMDFADLNDFINVITEHSNSSLSLYNALLSAGVCREQARMVLPVNLYTKFIMTADLHNLLHFLKLRLGNDTQYETRVYAQEIIKLIEPIVPVTLKHWMELNGIN